MNDLHLVIFCGAKYRKFLPYCIEGIHNNVRENFKSKTIVSNFPLKVEGFDNIMDNELWYEFDPKLTYPELYEFVYHKQQILKLSLDYAFTGDILIVDCDLLFIRPTNFIDNGVYNFYTSIEFDSEYFAFMNRIGNIPKITPEQVSFITDFAIFNTNYLKEIREYLEKLNNDSWLNTIQRVLHIDKEETYNLSEYELYGNYLLWKHPQKVKLIYPEQYIMRLEMDWENYNTKELIDITKKITRNNYQCIYVNPEKSIKESKTRWY